MTLIRLALALCGFAIFAGCSTRPEVNGVPNFSEVDAGIYRGGQPTAQGWLFLKSLGVTNVVKLNRESEDIPGEGVCVNEIPLPPATFWEIFRQPSSNDVWRAVQAMNHRGTYVHCTHGRDRTGLIVGCYRMRVDGWSGRAAAGEMSSMGYRWGLPGLNRSWRSAVKSEKGADK